MDIVDSDDMSLPVMMLNNNIILLLHPKLNVHVHIFACTSHATFEFCTCIIPLCPYLQCKIDEHAYTKSLSYCPHAHVNTMSELLLPFSDILVGCFEPCSRGFHHTSCSHAWFPNSIIMLSW